MIEHLCSWKTKCESGLHWKMKIDMAGFKEMDLEQVIIDSSRVGLDTDQLDMSYLWVNRLSTWSGAIFLYKCIMARFLRGVKEPIVSLLSMVELLLGSGNFKQWSVSTNCEVSADQHKGSSPQAGAFKISFVYISGCTQSWRNWQNLSKSTGKQPGEQSSVWLWHHVIVWHFWVLWFLVWEACGNERHGVRHGGIVEIAEVLWRSCALLNKFCSDLEPHYWHEGWWHNPMLWGRAVIFVLRGKICV